MASFNRVILMGNLTRDPELKYLPSNTAVCQFGLAVNHRWKDKDGNQKEEVCFVDVNAFGRPGEIINQYCTKGRPILIEGRLRLESWQAQDGTKRSKHSVIVENFQFIGSRGESGGGAPAQTVGEDSRWQGSGGGAARRSAPPAAPMDEPPAYDSPPPPQGEDIPF